MKTFQEILQEGRGTPRFDSEVFVKIGLWDQHDIFSFDGPFGSQGFDEDNWEEQDDGELIFTGLVKDFINDVTFPSDYDDDDDEEVSRIKETPEEIIKLIKDTPVGEIFSLYGREYDSCGCKIYEKTA